MYAYSPLENRHQMHEKSSPVIFNVVGGAGRWKSSENRGGRGEGSLRFQFCLVLLC